MKIRNIKVLTGEIPRGNGRSRPEKKEAAREIVASPERINEVMGTEL